MLVNRSGHKREIGTCSYCSDPRPSPLDPDGRCSACQGSALLFISQIDEPDPTDTGGRPIDLDPSISIPKLLDPDLGLGLSRVKRLALLMDSCCTPILLSDAPMPIYSLRLRPLLADWVRLNILQTRDSLILYNEHVRESVDLGPWSTYHFKKTMDIYILSRLMAAHGMELRAYARNVVFDLHKRYGPVQEWDRALGLHPLDDTTNLVFEWPCWLTLPPGLYGMPLGTPVPEIERSSGILGSSTICHSPMTESVMPRPTDPAESTS